MKKSLTKIFTILAVAFALSYLCFSFFLWDLNASRWEDSYRAGCVFIPLFVTFLSLPYTIEPPK